MFFFKQIFLPSLSWSTFVQYSVVQGVALLAVTAERTWPLTAHQPEPVFMEAEKDGALLEDQACLCSIWDAALLSYAGMLIR